MKKIVVFVLILSLIILVVIQVSGQSLKNDDMTSELNKIEHYLVHSDSINKEVSKVAVAWHLDHSLKVINGISDSLQNSDPTAYKRKFNIARFFSFTFGFIPRGRAQSPKYVLPPDTIKTEDIVAQLSLARDKLVALDSLDDKSNFNHPVFNQLNKQQAKKFIKIHTRHHLKIVRDILKE
ncbi:DUF1569 domain-containing protein [Aquimarina sp. MMG016]|uniref:DUF1569 domain-containing protein n=1 Tax=Aquimarina sp. MMG016 TaxID=2822690 RepID=UPI001B3A4252|nr:DUF1569 domain-containing protein [Aquimarina sp. MMG016]MBQ4819064.1 DUF1569 domain-containing protein [Aquimarina sp. MMG016]